MTRNPFSESYITETSLDSDVLLDKYSFSPFMHINDKITQKNNVVLKGRAGIGKTMLLKLFEPELLKRLYEKEDNNFLDKIPDSTVGTYINMATARINNFCGGGLNVSWWTAAYCDYLNCILLASTLTSLKKMGTVSRWLEKGGANIFQNEEWFDSFIYLMRIETPELDKVNTLNDFIFFNQERTKSWIQFVNSSKKDQSNLPTHTLKLGVPLFKLAEALKLTCIPKFRLFLLVDQYESLYAEREKIDFRPAFNQALSSASRGNTSVEFKIGTRKYAFDEYSNQSIEASREYVSVDLDVLILECYEDFIYDVFSKRLRKGKDGDNKKFAQRMVPGYKPMDEANRYKGSSHDNGFRHLNPYFRRWMDLGVGEHVIERVMCSDQISGHNILFSTIAAIGVTRWIRDNYQGCPFIAPDFKLAPLNENSVAHAFIELVNAVAVNHEKPKNKKDKRACAVDNLYRDTVTGALFHIATHLKNTRKYFCGFETIINISSGVALSFLEIMGAAYDELLMQNKDPFNDPLPQKIQRDAVYKISERSFENISKRFDYGTKMSKFIRTLGQAFHKVQLELTIPLPAPNSFSVPADVLLSLNQNENGDLISLLINWGVLEESTHDDKNKSNGKRKKLAINKIYTPYFGISSLSKKDPIYVSVDELSEFCKDLLEGKEPKQFKNIHRRSKNIDSINRNKATKMKNQYELFKD